MSQLIDSSPPCARIDRKVYTGSQYGFGPHITEESLTPQEGPMFSIPCTSNVRTGSAGFPWAGTGGLRRRAGTLSLCLLMTAISACGYMGGSGLIDDYERPSAPVKESWSRPVSASPPTDAPTPRPPALPLGRAPPRWFPACFSGLCVRGELAGPGSPACRSCSVS